MRTSGRAVVGGAMVGLVLAGFGLGVLAAPGARADVVPLARTADSGRQADLVAGEDRRITVALLRVRPDPAHPKTAVPVRRVSLPGLDTLVLTKRRQPYTFDELRRLTPETLIPQPDGSYLLCEHILVAAGATLTISPHKPLVIKMCSGPDGFTSLVTMGGRLRLDGSAAAPITLESWDESRGRPDRDVADGRAYVRASGQLIVRHTTFSRLGFWSGRTGGLSVVGTGSTVEDDVTAVVPSATVTDVRDPAAKTGTPKGGALPAGKLPGGVPVSDQSFATQISDATITGNAFGLFITGSSGPGVTRTVIQKSLVDGLVLHRNVDSATISDVRVEQSGEDGVVVSRQVEGTVLTRLVVRRNGRDGIVLAGRALAEGPSASGSSIRAFGNNRITASESSDNARIGIHVIGGTAVRILGNTVSGGRAGIVVSDGATDIDVDSNQVAGASGNGVQVRESTHVMVTANSVRDSPTGFHIRNSISTLRQNSTSGVTLHGITLVGQVGGSLVEANRLAGSGTSAIDTIRVSDHRHPTLRNNELNGWARTVTSDSLLSALLHPLTVIWLFVALALVAMSRPRGGVARLPYQSVPLGESQQFSRSRQQFSPVQQFSQVEPLGPVQQFSQVQAFGPAQRTGLAPRAQGFSSRSTPMPPTQTRTSNSAVFTLPEAEHPVIDLALREARLSPAVPRRRRSVGR